MTSEEALTLLGLLVGATTGWDHAADSTFDEYQRQFEMLDSAAAGHAAVQAVVKTWDRPVRPPWAAVYREYLAACRREIMDHKQLPGTDGLIVSPAEGRQIAARAYAAHCRRVGREPNWAYFDRMAGVTKRSPDEAPLSREQRRRR